MANYLIYPFKTMRITQSYNGKTSHYPHTTGTPKDYPLDEGGADGGRDPFYCPCDEMEIARIYGVGNGGTNTLWVQSTSKVNFADGTSDYCTIQITHPNDSDIKGLKKGQKFKRSEVICREGTDGATGNHIHHSVGKGKMTGTGWTKNSKGKYVISTTGGGVKPENAYVIDEAFTKRVIDNKGLKFKTLAAVKKAAEKPVTKKYTTGTYEVTADILHVRKGPSVHYDAKIFSQLTKDAQTKIKKLAGTTVNGYVKNLVFTCTEIKNNWGKTPSGWVCLDYCKKI